MPLLSDMKVERKNGSKSTALYQQISQKLRSHIESGKVKRGERLPSASQLVNQFGVDYKTVNSAFQILADEGLIKINAERGKGPIISKQSARKHSMMFLRWDCSPMELQFDQGIRRFAKEQGDECITIDASRSHERCIESIIHPIKHVEGMLVMPHECPGYKEAVLSIIDSGVKVVFVDRVLDDVSVSAVSIDHASGSYKATKHLLELHKRPVYYIGFIDRPSSARNRYMGWSAAMSEYSFCSLADYTQSMFMPEHELATDPKKGLQNSFESAIQLFKTRNDKQYSIFAMNDQVAHGVYHAAEEMGLKIGTDVALVGFGDFPLCEQLSVPLSSVMQTNEDVGYEAAKLLHLELIGSIKKPLRCVLPAELCIRASSGI